MPSRPTDERLDPGLTDSEGLRFGEFRRTLAPRYARVWIEIGFGYAMLGAIVWATTLARTPWEQAAAAAFGALGVGYFMAYLQLYFHEGAHFLLAPRRSLNDLFTNLLIGMWLGQNVKTYRKIHFEHHRALGLPEDTERTYFEQLTVRFLLESLLGMRAVKVLLWRRRVRDAVPRAPKSTTPARHRLDRWPLAVGLLVHAGLLSTLVSGEHYGAMTAWCVGIAMVYPFLASLRQLLEHRALPAAGEVLPYHAAAHRMFGVGPLASTFGAAGFNRHLLHHLQPQVSCTRLHEVERFLSRTSQAAWLEGHRTSYARAFRALLKREPAVGARGAAEGGQLLNDP